MKLAFIGIGKVGFALANRLQQKGHEVVVAHENSESKSVVAALLQNPNLKWSLPQEAIDNAEVVFLATPFKLNKALLSNLDLTNKIVIDCTNPVGAGISHGLESKISGAEKVQEWAKGAKVVKSYTIYGYENLESPPVKGAIKPVMLIAGNDIESKNIVSVLNTDLGFETLDTGALSQSLHLEHMTLLWVKMVRANGHTPNFTWAYLEK